MARWRGRGRRRGLGELRLGRGLRGRRSANASTIPAAIVAGAGEERDVVAADQRAGERRGRRPPAPFVWLAAIVLSTASPSAPLICWETLVIPEPSPASAAGTSAIASVSSGMNALPMPSPIAKQAKKIVGKKAVSGPTVLNRSSPATALAMPAGEDAERRRSARPAAP